MAGYEQMIYHPELTPVPGSAPPGELAGRGAASAMAAGKMAALQLPGYMDSLSNIGTSIARKTAGQVPEDVINLLKQQGAESNVSTGLGSNAAYLRALGLTSLGLEEQGQKDFESILPALPGYGISQSPQLQGSANLQYEKELQPEIFRRQDAQQQFAIEQQRQALEAAQKGYNTGPGGNIQWGNPTNAWAGGGVDALGWPNTTTATLPGQTSAAGVTVPGGSGGGVAYGGGGPIQYW